MKLLRSMLLTAAVTALLPLPLGTAHAVTETVQMPDGARLIVRFKASAASVRAKALSARATASDAASTTQARALSLGQRMGVPLAGGRALDERTQVVTGSGQTAQALVQKLSQDSEVEWVAVDQRRKHYAVPNDPLFTAGPVATGPAAGQWYLKAPNVGSGGEVAASINTVAAWDRTTGSASVVVAVLDTGVRYDHPDLAGKLLPGYDMISEAVIGNDGDARDSDASDAGDWVNAADQTSSTFKDCEVEPSSWHGTQVSGLIGAASNNGVGMAGVSWGSKILPVRVLGKCGGYDSDIVAGMRWAAGLSVPGVPANTTPAKVLNMSLGGSGSCTGTGTAELYRDAITAVTAQGAVVVVAAGNSTGRAVNLPANCPGVIGVVAVRHIGTKVGFSDLGPEISIAAPGGNCVNVGAGEACLYPMLSTVNSGTTTAQAGGSIYTDSFRAAYGTSFSAPLVSGTVALMLSQRSNLTPAEIISTLKSTARSFPSSGAANNADGTPIKQCLAPTGTDQLECYCTTGTCGAGMLDAAAAVASASGMAANISVSPAAPQAGQAVQLSGAASTAGTGSAIASYAWTLVNNGGGIVSGFSSATNASTAALQAATGAGSVVVRLQITDSQGVTFSTDATITVTAAPVQDSGGGGGALQWVWLAGLALATAGLAWARAVKRLQVRRIPARRS